MTTATDPKNTFKFEELVQPFVGVSYISTPEGYIVWRVGTGGNAELLHIRAYEKRRGVGRKLVRTMVELLKTTPPYAEVFGFTRVVNEAAHAFYTTLGFKLSLVSGVYKDGKAVLFSQPYESLLQRFADAHPLPRGDWKDYSYVGDVQPGTQGGGVLHESGHVHPGREDRVPEGGYDPNAPPQPYPQVERGND